MDIKQMQYFITIVNSKFNLSKASKELNITQPNLSMLIQELEAAYKIKLLVKKNSRYIGLTAEGEILYREAKKVINSFNSLQFKLTNMQNEYHGTLRIGIPPIFLSTYFSDIISQFIIQYPDIYIEIVEENATILRQMLLDEKLDFAILIGEHSDVKEFHSSIIYKDKFAIFVNKNNPIANTNKIDINRLNHQNLVLLKEIFILDTLIEKKLLNNISPNIIFRSGQWNLLIKLVLSSNLITILPKAIDQQVHDKSLVTLDFTEDIEWSISLTSNLTNNKNNSSLLFEKIILNYFKTKI